MADEAIEKGVRRTDAESRPLGALADASSDDFDHCTFWPMLGTALLGVFIAAGSVYSFKQSCGQLLKDSVDNGICFAMQQNPPWIPLASLASAPSLLLTWYWRTTHRKKDLAQKDREQNFQEAEVDRQKFNGLRGDVRHAIDSLTSQSPGTVDKMLRFLDKARNEVRLQDEIAGGLVQFLKEAIPSLATEDVAKSQSKRNREHALRMLAAMAAAGDGARIDLHGAHLDGLVIDFDLRLFDLMHADLTGAELYGADLRGTILTNVLAEGAVFDSSTQLDTEARMALVFGNAKEFPKPRHPTADEIMGQFDQREASPALQGMTMPKKAEDELRRTDQEPAGEKEP